MMEEKRVLKPTVGRMLHYWPNGPAQKEGGGQPEAAVVASVHGDRCVNITAFTPSGHPYGATSVLLRQPDDVVTTGAFAEWMPYQEATAGQGARAETAIGLLEGKMGELEATLARLTAANTDEFREALSRAGREAPVKSG